MGKRAIVAVGISIGLLAVAQAAAVFPLRARLDVPPDLKSDPLMQMLSHRMAYDRAVFHFAGTILAAIGLAAFASTASPGRMIAWLFAPLALSAAMWLQWAVRGFPGIDPIEGMGGIAGVLLGTVVPLVGIVALALRLRRRAGVDRVAAGRGIAFAAAVLVWSWAFAVMQFLVGVAA